MEDGETTTKFPITIETEELDHPVYAHRFLDATGAMGAGTRISELSGPGAHEKPNGEGVPS